MPARKQVLLVLSLSRADYALFLATLELLYLVPPAFETRYGAVNPRLHLDGDELSPALVRQRFISGFLKAKKKIMHRDPLA